MSTMTVYGKSTEDIRYSSAEHNELILEAAICFDDAVQSLQSILKTVKYLPITDNTDNPITDYTGIIIYTIKKNSFQLVWLA